MLSFSTFQETFSSSRLQPEPETFLLALSGGADSMVLANLFVQSHLPFQAAHVNYHLRGEDSNRDQQLVEDFCARNRIKLHLFSAAEEDIPAGSIQVWARDLRYTFFRSIMQKEGLNHLVTAHHRNDQVETFFINLLRGSGIRGLSGMPEDENAILRPLLHFSKKEIYDYAASQNISFREDLSNKKNIYVRNRLRNEIIPKLEEMNPQFLENTAKSMEILADTKDFAEAQLSQILEEISTEGPDGLRISKDRLARQLPFARYEILRRFGFTDVHEETKMFSAHTGSFFYSDTHTLLVNRQDFILTPGRESKNTATDERIVIAESADSLLDIQKISLGDISELSSAQPFSWTFDVDRLIFPITLRHSKEGDFFYPTGMKGRKKISKFLKDEKISVLAKQKIWLLCDGNDDILGVVPLRQDRRGEAQTGSRAVILISNG